LILDEFTLGFWLVHVRESESKVDISVASSGSTFELSIFIPLIFAIKFLQWNFFNPLQLYFLKLRLLNADEIRRFNFALNYFA